jgi:hypothetical protein
VRPGETDVREVMIAQNVFTFHGLGGEARVEGAPLIAAIDQVLIGLAEIHAAGVIVIVPRARLRTLPGVGADGRIVGREICGETGGDTFDKRGIRRRIGQGRIDSRREELRRNQVSGDQGSARRPKALEGAEVK